MFNHAKLDESGWGIVISENEDPLILEALKPLLETRREQAGDLFLISKYKPGECAKDFLERYMCSFGPADPSHIPYYLLIVGGPKQVPFRFQYQLGITYAVGRIAFDCIEDYFDYSITVYEHELSRKQGCKDISFFAPIFDEPTYLSSCKLVEPLSCFIREKFSDWEVGCYHGEEGLDKKRFLSILYSNPALFFSASHGFVTSTERWRLQLERQGSIIVHPWNPRHKVSRNMVVLWDDLEPNFRFKGMIAFLFNCFSAGTPRYCSYSMSGEKKKICDDPFIATLPKEMLRRGALAIIGHVDKIFTSSFLDENAQPHLTVYKKFLSQLLSGETVGHSMNVLSSRHAEMSAYLIDQMLYNNIYDDPLRAIKKIQERLIDARNFILLGDPAVRIFK